MNCHTGLESTVIKYIRDNDGLSLTQAAPYMSFQRS